MMVYVTKGGAAVYDPKATNCCVCGKRTTLADVTVRHMCLTCWGDALRQAPLVPWEDIPNCFTGKIGGASTQR